VLLSGFRNSFVLAFYPVCSWSASRPRQGIILFSLLSRTRALMKGGLSMTNTLPAKADLNLLKKQAKKLLKQYRNGDADALTAVNTYHPKPESFNVLR